MKYQLLFGCHKCSNLDERGECNRKDAFDDGDPSTNPFLHCPCFSFNYDLMIPKKGEFYILESQQGVYTPIYWDTETISLIQMRKCELINENGINKLILDMKYPYVITKERDFIINNATKIYIDSTSIIY